MLRQLKQSSWRVLALGITKEGAWRLTDATPEELKSGAWATKQGNRTAFLSPDAQMRGLVALQEGGGFEVLVPDVAFGLIHGRHGEDGALQGLFELAGLPYVGPGVAASAVCMDKGFAKMLAQAAGIAQTPFVLLNAFDYKKNPEQAHAHIAQALRFPVFVKPCNAGSSIGISRVEAAAQLPEAIEAAAEIDRRIVIEQGVLGREIECAVLGNEQPIASLCGEVQSGGVFYDYEAKYHNSASKTLVPAPLPQEVADLVRKTALEVYALYDCRGMARVDFFYSEDGEVLLNEVNTIPGFTDISMYPMMLEKSGLPYGELLERLLALGQAAMGEGH